MDGMKFLLQMSDIHANVKLGQVIGPIFMSYLAKTQ